MKRSTVLATIIVCFLAGVASAQYPGQMPQAGPEQKRLQYYAVTWTTEFEMKTGGGKATATDRTQMLPGGFFAVTHTEGKGVMGEMHEVAIMGYDSDAKFYTYDSYNNFGEAEHFKGTVQGDTWTWNGDSKFGGGPMKMRFTAKEVSPTMYTMKLEVMTGANWSTVMEGKSTKTK